MVKWILILLVVAAMAGLLGFDTISGVAAAGVVLVLFPLALFGIVAIA